MKTLVLSPNLPIIQRCLAILIALACMAVWPALSHAMEAAKQAASETTIVQFDVSESGPRFVFDEAPVFDDGLPAYGNAFVTEGYIFPYGYLDSARTRIQEHFIINILGHILESKTGSRRHA